MRRKTGTLMFVREVYQKQFVDGEEIDDWVSRADTKSARRYTSWTNWRDQLLSLGSFDSRPKRTDSLNQDTIYENGVFIATLKFPRDYPLSPPTMVFQSEMFHPNIYPDGTVCISILHAPGNDPNGYEHASERWSPVQSVEKILLSVVSMLAGLFYLTTKNLMLKVLQI